MKKVIVFAFIVGLLLTSAWSGSRHDLRVEVKLKVTNLATGKSYFLSTVRLVNHGDDRAVTINDCVGELLRTSSAEQYTSIEKARVLGDE